MAISRRPKGDKAASSQPAQNGGGGGKPNIKKATFDTTRKKEIGVSDLTLISKVTNEAINDNLKMRFEGGEIYTYIGHVLVSVNPFRDLGIYTDEKLASYIDKNRLEMPPHVFAVAEAAYYQMRSYNENQCVIISGESGAGKTEAAKRLMQYIANVSGGSNSSIQQVKDMVLATNPLLESFGNAKTLRNNNSSRFGKYLQLQFNAKAEPVGADITNYLLEKSRVVGQIQGERNFHIFYQFTKGASETYRNSFGIQKPENYAYLNKSKCFSVEGIDDLQEFRDTLAAMKVIGISQEEEFEIFRVLAAILWTGNIVFGEDRDGYAVVSDTSVTDFLAYLLEVDPANLIKAITIRILTPRNGEVIESPANPAQATATRDALAKALYYNLFDWIVERVNVSLKAPGDQKNSIGILDIYGFEIFEKNSFEQLCINYVNEKLQQIFIQLTLKAEQEEYDREQIKWTPIKYFDNKIVCDLIEATRPPGIFSAMKDATKTAHADPAASDRTFVQSINGMSNPHLTVQQGRFIVKHYAGDVTYTVEGITDKNKDQLLKGLLNLFGQSQNDFIHRLFPNEVNQDDRRQPPSAGDKIKTSANELVATLMKARPSYIRTIKPNENKSPTEYNTKQVLHQIKYLGLQENVRIRRAGFASRQTYEVFVDRFHLLSPETSFAGVYTWTGDARSGVKQILKDTSIPVDEYQMGVSKVFIKSPETLFALETMKDKFWHNMAIRIQRMWRGYLAIRSEAATRIQKLWRKKRVGADFLRLREQGHQVLQGRKQRRRASLIGSRRFMGDYLGVMSNGNASNYGTRVRQALNCGNEKLVFSCFGEVLETKFGRSSKPSARTIVLTNSKFYVVVLELVNKQASLRVERSIPLGAIKFVGASTCRDDWFSLGIGSPQEADPLMNCVFKTELFTQMKLNMPGGFNLKIADSIEYAKKPGKMQLIKVIKDSPNELQDFYKSGAVHTTQGEPPNSVSRPMPPSKPVPPKPFTKGKLIRPGGPGGRPSRIGNGNRNAARPTPGATSRPAASQSQLPPKPAAISALNHSLPNHTRGSSTGVTRVPPPPPPAAPPRASAGTHRLMFDFDGQTATELNARQGDLITVVKMEGNGWCLGKDSTGREGWVPASYLKEETPAPVARHVPPPPPPAAPRKPNGVNGAVARAKPTPPAPPAKRPTAGGRKLVASEEPRDSGVNVNGANGSSGDSGRSTPVPVNLGGLADALRARQSAMQKDRDNDDDEW